MSENNQKLVTCHTPAVENLFLSVGGNNFCCYDVPNFPISSLSTFYTPEYLSKCSHFTVAISGEAKAGKDWLLVCPHRIDNSGKFNAKVADLDPFIAVLDSASWKVYPTGIVRYHSNFDERTSLIEGYESLSKAETVATLRQELVTGLAPLAEAPNNVLNALQFMVTDFKKTFKM